jgi:Flp pilus assembly protein TadD
MRRAPIAVPIASLLAFAAGAGCAAFQGARLYHSGTHALESGDTQAAIADLEGAAERVPNASEVHTRLGVAYAAAGRRGDAIREFQSAVALDCANDVAAGNLARALAEQEGSP